MVGNLPQPFEVIELDVPAFAADETFTLKWGKYSAYRFFRDTQVISYVTSRHSEIKIGRGTVALGKLL